MAKRIATQLKEAINQHLDNGTWPSPDELAQWYEWAKKLNASMRYDGSARSRHRKARRT